jgi:hypothetical protein
LRAFTSVAAAEDAAHRPPRIPVIARPPAAPPPVSVMLARPRSMRPSASSGTIPSRLARYVSSCAGSAKNPKIATAAINDGNSARKILNATPAAMDGTSSRFTSRTVAVSATL